MNKKRMVAFLLGATIITGLAFNAATTANYTENLGQVTQTINAATWDVKMGNGLGSHTIFPGDEISNDTITLTNNNDYAVKFEVRLNIADNGLHNALTFDLKDGEVSTGILKSGGIYIVTVAPKSNVSLNSYVKWEPNETENKDIELEGNSVAYNYDIVAVADLQEGRPVYVNNFDKETDLASWSLNGASEDSMSLAEGGGMKVKDGIFTRFDGYRTDGTTDFTNTTVLDLSELEDLEGFDYSIAANGKDGNHKQDYIFHIYKSGENIYINADNNSGHKVPANIVGQEGTINTTDTTLTLIQKFYADGDKFKCDMTVENSNGSKVFVKTIQGVYNATEIGGNRYGWFLAMGKNQSGSEASGLAKGIVVKSSSLEIKPQSEVLASNLVASGW